MLVAIRVSHKRGGIDHSFIVDQLVFLGLWHSKGNETYIFRSSLPSPLFWQILGKSAFLFCIPLVGPYSKPILRLFWNLIVLNEQDTNNPFFSKIFLEKNSYFICARRTVNRLKCLTQ